MSKEKILIVEDDTIFAEMVNEYLLSFGYDVVGN